MKPLQSAATLVALVSFAPATVANVACGYDVLGFAIDSPGDEIVFRFSDKPGLHITKITGDNGKLPKNPAQNCAGVAALDFTQAPRHVRPRHRDGNPQENALRLRTRVLLRLVRRRAFAVNQLIGNPLSKKQLLPFAMAGEASADGAWHADNVAPASSAASFSSAPTTSSTSRRSPRPKTCGPPCPSRH